MAEDMDEAMDAIRSNDCWKKRKWNAVDEDQSSYIECKAWSKEECRMLQVLIESAGIAVQWKGVAEKLNVVFGNNRSAEGCRRKISHLKVAGKARNVEEQTETTSRRDVGVQTDMKTELPNQGHLQNNNAARSEEKIAEEYNKFSRRLLSESQLKTLDFPRPDPRGEEGDIKLYGDHFGFVEGYCKRCEKPFDATFQKRTQCDFHTEKSLRYGGKQHPRRCCGKGLGAKGCRIAPSHVYKGNLYLDLKGYRRTEKRDPPVLGHHRVFAIDTESVHTIKGLEVCKVSVIDTKLNVVYDQYCLPTSEIVDYNTIWSGITAKDLEGVTKTFEELRDDLFELISADTIIVGHGVNHDLISLKILHDKVVDTVVLYPHKLGFPRRRSLKEIAQTEMGVIIQTGEGHDSEEDAKVTMRLALRKV